ncbi:calcium-binding protein [Leisingera sp. M658]|uniref:calcium-binding protein n=1 Tax=Leisingera sp. M658 TaxID=2867015 RepID=UPI0021A699C3|nr:calcium-binding protein [Leisingera sp. M658]UWQ73418.1 hypothetical protein K3724_12715 [Leisingera sp. M658]
MTTFSLRGIRVDYSGDDIAAASAIQAEVVVPSASTTFSYTITGHQEDNVAEISLTGGIRQLRIEGRIYDHSTDAPGYETLITSVTWSGGTSIVLIVAEETGPNSDTDYIFHLDGPAFPAIGTLQEWISVNDSITSLMDPTGSFAPGADIPWSTFTHSTVSEEDTYVGTSGNDTLTGTGADDYFISSEGNDRYNGSGSKYDQVTFNNDPGGVTANLKTGKATDGWGDTDTLRSIEMLRGSAFDDDLSGNGKRNFFRGLAGDDTINGRGGRDEVRYDRDERYGGEDGATVNLSKGFAIDGFGDRDTLKSIENARGTDSGDKITGSSTGNRIMGLGGNDTLSGKGGNDTIFGGGGKDRINGDGGNDLLSGEGGADRFIFKGTFGNDTVSDFSTSGRKEKIDLSDVTTIKHFRDLKNNHLSENDDGDAVIRDNRGNTITLEDIAIADLSGNDFLF